MNDAIIETERCLSSAHNQVLQKQNECVAKISGNVLKYLDMTIDDMWKPESCNLIALKVLLLALQYLLYRSVIFA